MADQGSDRSSYSKERRRSVRGDHDPLAPTTVGLSIASTSLTQKHDPRPHYRRPTHPALSSWHDAGTHRTSRPAVASAISVESVNTVRTACLILAFAIAGCIGPTPRYEDADAWRTPPVRASRGSVTRSARPLPASTTAAARSTTNTRALNAWAKAYRTPNQCVSGARTGLERNANLSLQRLMACSRRDDFDVLMPLLRSPWNELLLTQKSIAYRVLLRAIARRGEFGADFGSMQVAGFPIGEMGIDGAEPGRLTPIVGLTRSGGATQIDELGQRRRRHGLRPGTWRWTRYRVYSTGRKQVLSSHVFKVGQPSKRSPGLVLTGKAIRLSRRLRCAGKHQGAKVLFVRLGRQLEDENGIKIFEAEAVACQTAPASAARIDADRAGASTGP